MHHRSLLMPPSSTVAYRAGCGAAMPEKAVRSRGNFCMSRKLEATGAFYAASAPLEEQKSYPATASGKPIYDNTNPNYVVEERAGYRRNLLSRRLERRRAVFGAAVGIDNTNLEHRRRTSILWQSGLVSRNDQSHHRVP